MSFVQRLEQGVENRIEADVMTQMGAGNCAPVQDGGIMGRIEADIARRIESQGGVGGGIGGQVPMNNQVPMGGQVLGNQVMGSQVPLGGQAIGGQVPLGGQQVYRY